MSETAPIVAIDLGGTRFRVALVSPEGAVLDRVGEASRSEEGPEAVADRIARASERLLHEAGVDAPAGYGAAVAGPIDTKGVIYNPPNLHGWGTVPFRELLERRVGGPVAMGNDANVAVLGEAMFGAARGVDDAIYMTVSTGVGGGILTGGKLVTGLGMASEVGHIIIGYKQRRSLEDIASGTAIAARARRALEEGEQGLIRDLVQGDGKGVRAEHVFQAARQGDAFAAGIVADVAEALGAGISSLVHVFNPRVLVLGGGVIRDWDMLEAGVRSTAKSLTFAEFYDKLRISVSEFGDDVGLLGAAALVLRGGA